MNLLQLVRQFRDASHASLRDGRSQGQCWRVSVRLARLLRSHGYDAHVGTNGWSGNYHAVTVVVLAGRLVSIDFTARQFSLAALFPVVGETGHSGVDYRVDPQFESDISRVSEDEEYRIAEAAEYDRVIGRDRLKRYRLRVVARGC